jgi:threonine aldolase
MRSFASDNNSGVHSKVLEALQQANQGHAIGYGDDPWTDEAQRLFKQTFGPLSETVLVLNGTGGNIVALQLATKPFNSILCSDTAHILVDECGAPVKSTGCPIFSLPTTDGKLTPELIKQKLHGFGDQHHSQPGVVYISQCTELGTVYTPEEIREITALAHQYGLYVHMDGARLANAAAALQVSLRALTTDCGVDILSFGGTKNGLMMGESVVIMNTELIKNAKFIRKQSAQLASKMRYLSVQFSSYLQDDLWLKNAAHANEMAKLLYHELNKYPEVRFTQIPETNALFLTLPRPIIDELLKQWFFYFWNEANNEIRLVCSFDTTKDDVLAFLSDLEKAFINYSL